MVKQTDISDAVATPDVQFYRRRMQVMEVETIDNRFYKCALRFQPCFNSSVSLDERLCRLQ